MPRQIGYIIGNEACERFSFYGMRNILVPFLVSSVLLGYLPEGSMRDGAAKDIFHIFVIGVYFFPLLGGWLADRWLGKYHTILWFSLIYCAGHACLALFEQSPHGFYTGLFLIALGSGGIKPLVVSFCGDQFDQRNKHKAKVVFDAFYWIINFGSFFASLFAPLLLRSFGAAVAFGVPGVLMLIATLVFWLGRGRYINVPPARRDNADSFLAVVKTALNTAEPGQRRPGRMLAVAGVAASAVMLLAWALSAGAGLPVWPTGFGFVITACLALGLVIACGGYGVSLQLQRARGRHPDAAVNGVQAVLRVMIVFALVTPFWSLFDQKASTWILQGQAMILPDSAWWPGWLIRDAAQMQALNPLLVMLLIPFNTLVLYPLLQKLGLTVTALRRMGWGIAFSGLSWVVAGILQLWLDAGASVSLAWQALPYLLLTFGEVLVSATALEFAYSQAPQAMKGVIMAFWYLTSTFGSLWVLITNAGVRHPAVIERIAQTGLSENAFLMFFFALFAFLAALVFAWYARRYPMQDHYRLA